jgi:hypothetical protein
MAKWRLWKSHPRVVLGSQSPSIDLLFLPIHRNATSRVGGKLQKDRINVKTSVTLRCSELVDAFRKGA